MSTPGTTPLPPDWTRTTPAAPDVPELHALLRRHETAARGSSGASLQAVEADVVGAGAATRQHLLLRDPAGGVRAWGTVHDRAAGRSVVAVVVDPELPTEEADTAASALLTWIEQVSAENGAERSRPTTQLDSGAFADDARQSRWLAVAGYQRVRTWWQMGRPVGEHEADPGVLPPPKPGVVVRRVARDRSDGLPVQRDLAAVHSVLEAAFTDHFNYHEETFEEFCSRLREDPGHRWDHWWIAEVEQDGRRRPAGALVASVTAHDPPGSYVEYLGVLRSARGRGVAKSLLHSVFADAAARDRPTVGIEVDADSPTGAADLYLAMGFTTSYETASWHKELPVPGS
ncbi:GNAT family N-acetyltransferase [soil metagenome]